MRNGVLDSSSKTSDGVIIRRLLSLVWQYRFDCLGLVFLQTWIIAFGVFIIYLTGLGVDELQAALSAETTPLRKWFPALAEWSPFSVILATMGVAAGVAGLRTLLDFSYRIWVDRLVQVGLVVPLRGEVYDKLQRLSFRFFDANASSSLISRVTRDVQRVRMFLDQVMLPSATLILALGVNLSYMMTLNVKLTTACLLPLVLLGWVSYQFSKRVQPAYLEGSRQMDRVIQGLSENVKGIEVVRSFAREKEELRRFEEVNREVSEQKKGIFTMVSRYTVTVGLISQSSQVVLLGYGGYLVIQGSFPLGTGLMVFATLLSQFATQVVMIATIANSLQESLAGARRVFEVLDTPEGVVDRPEATVLPEVKGDVRFENILFDHGQDPVLKEINFSVKAGECVAIFGPTGSGKSALLSLIPRFYDPTEGRVLLDGHDLRDLSVNSVRKRIGIVFQESFLFKKTVAENIAFGVPNASREQIEKAAKVAVAHDFIMGLPNGYDTVLGGGGSGLSGGQRQRLAIARALLLDPAILILDDPTAALDAGTEAELAEAIFSAMRGRTTFLVAHRQSMLRWADFIVVLDRGRVSQIGTHAALMEQEGVYSYAMTQKEEAAGRALVE